MLTIKKYDDGEYAVTDDDTHYHIDTMSAVITQLEYARKNKLRVRLWLGYTERYIKSSGQNDRVSAIGTAWPEEHDVIGTIVRTTRPRHCPILLYNARSHGGDIISTNCIVAIRTARTWLYRHPKFTTGVWEAGNSGDKSEIGAAFHNGQVHARFKTNKQAARYCDFMTGKRFNR